MVKFNPTVKAIVGRRGHRASSPCRTTSNGFIRPRHQPVPVPRCPLLLETPGTHCCHQPIATLSWASGPGVCHLLGEPVV